MTIDMSKIRPGCILPCRERVVESVIYHADEIYPNEIKYVGENASYDYDHDGKFAEGHDLFDITSIIEPPFDWDAVKPGDRFDHFDIGVVRYVGPVLDCPDGVWAMVENRPEPEPLNKRSLTPINDKEI